MSNPASPGTQHDDAPRDGDDQDRETPTLERVAPSLADPIRKTGFWVAIVLPVFYLPLLLVGLSSTIAVGLFVGLVAMHLFALYVGHAHRRRDDTSGSAS